MIQQTFQGPSAQAFLSHICPTSISGLQPYSSSLSVLLNESGGIIDDMIVTKHANDNEFYVVTNAGRAKEDGEWIAHQLQQWNTTEGKGKGKEVDWKKFDGYGLVALQGASITPISDCISLSILPQDPSPERCCRVLHRTTCLRSSSGKPRTWTFRARSAMLREEVTRAKMASRLVATLVVNRRCANLSYADFVAT
jgi:hypothetical protein